MTRKQSNYLCLAISFLPVLIGLLLFARLPNYPATHIFGNNSLNPSAIDKQTFIVLIMVSGLGFYFFSLILSNYLGYVSSKMNLVATRIWINGALTLLVYWLLVKNLT